MPQPEELDVKFNGPMPIGYDISRIQSELAEGLNKLKPGMTGGLFISGNWDTHKKEIIVASVHRFNDHISVQAYSKFIKGQKPSFGFNAEIQW